MGTAACGQFRQTLLLGSGQGLLRERCPTGQFQHGFQQNAAFELHRIQSRFCQFLLHRLHGGTGRIYHLSSSISSGMQGFSAAMAHSMRDASGSRVVMLDLQTGPRQGTGQPVVAFAGDTDKLIGDPDHHRQQQNADDHTGST